MTHTATPWNCKETKTFKGLGEAYIDYGFQRVAICYSDEGVQKAEDNANYIVKCVNSHDAFVEACKALEQFETTPDKDVVTISYKAIQRAREALKLASE